MRRSYISPEFIYQKVNGTFNMTEQSSFFGSKMLNIDKSISIKSDNIIYYQNSNNEQVDLNSERSLPQILYDAVIDKKNNHTIMLDDAQTEDQKNGNARWILDIQIKSVLRDYLFATLKKWRTFEGVLNTMSVSNSIDSAIYEYIDNNILSRYNFSRIEFFYQPVNLLNLGGLKYDNQFDVSIESNSTLFTKFQTSTDPNGIDLRLTFSQDQLADYYAFSYYYNLYFEKI